MMWQAWLFRKGFYMKKMLLLVFMLCSLVPFGTASASSLSSYPDFCELAAQDDSVFSSFKRAPAYQVILEHVGFATGQAYLADILRNSPEFVALFDKFRENDAIGNPITYDYGKYGRFSPTTLRYIKVASDIKRMIGDVSGMRIVEIGGGYGGQCKILADAMGFATYTIIDLEKCVPLIEKFLSLQQVSGVQCLASDDVAAVGPCDLVISNYAFSEVDSAGQREYIKYVIEGAPNGYMTLNFLSDGRNSSMLAEIEKLLLQSNCQSNVVREEPNTSLDNVIFTWQPRSDASGVSQQSSRYFQKGNAVTNSGGGARLGDQLLGYLHAKWVAYKYGLPFILTPFSMCEEFCLSERDATLTPDHCFQHSIVISNIEQVEAIPQSTLYTVPYFSEYRYEFASGGRNPFGIEHFQVDWDDPGFHEEIVACLQPRRERSLLINQREMVFP